MHVHSAVLEQLKGEAASSKDEICGALIGTTYDIVGALSLQNRSIDPNSSFYIAATDVLALQQRGLEVCGFYHSHPQSAAVPSARDVESALPGYVYMIITRAGIVRAWRLREDRSGFDEIEWLPK